jgi:hypothetical protein
MVRLFGVSPGAILDDSGFPSAIWRPSNEFVGALGKLPKGSSIGLEMLPEADFEDMQRNLDGLCEACGLESKVLPRAEYWIKLAGMCRDLGLNPVPIEDKSIWYDFNKAFVEKYLMESLGLSDKSPSESYRSYCQKNIHYSESLFKVNVLYESIGVLDRARHMIKAIAEKGVDAAIVSYDNANRWRAEPERVHSDFGVKFSSFSAELFNPVLSAYAFKDPVLPDSRLAFNFTSIQRALNLVEKGTLTGKIPDLVGVEEVLNPSAGYFEMFIDKNASSGISGRIIDCGGDALFEGAVRQGSIRFTKIYCFSLNNLVKTPFVYCSRAGTDGMFSGFSSCVDESVGRWNAKRFVLEKYSGRTPYEITLSWLDSASYNCLSVPDFQLFNPN